MELMCAQVSVFAPGWGDVYVCNGFMRLSLKVCETEVCVCVCVYPTSNPSVYIWLSKFE